MQDTAILSWPYQALMNKYNSQSSMTFWDWDWASWHPLYVLDICQCHGGSFDLKAFYEDIMDLFNNRG